MKKTSSRADLPTATAHEHRMQIFDATRRPGASSRPKEILIWSADGEIISHILRTGRLGQGHADVLDAIFFCAEKKGTLEDGRIKLLVDPARVRRIAGIGGEQLLHLVRELEAVVLEIREPAELACMGHLIDHIDIARKADGSTIKRPNPLGGERELWRVEVGKALCKLLAADIWKTYDPTHIARLPHGVSQAIARYALMHQHQPRGGWKLDTLIEVVAGELDDVAMRHRRREVREDKDLLAGAGVLLTDDDRISVR